MAIKTHDKQAPDDPIKVPPNNAMVFELVRTGLLYYFNEGKVVLLHGEVPSITAPAKILFPGKVIYEFQEKQELWDILAGDGDRYILETEGQTVRVLARFRV